MFPIFIIFELSIRFTHTLSAHFMMRWFISNCFFWSFSL